MVARFAGEGSAVTEPFEVDGPFNVRWQSERADNFRILLEGFSGGIPSIVADPALSGSSAGEVSYLRGGTYRFEVHGVGPWEIEVIAERAAR
jgi:hypothetical protein